MKCQQTKHIKLPQDRLLCHTQVVNRKEKVFEKNKSL